ncbi:MAG: NTP transferase domain-containing protein [Candidatus Brocadiales bacterium]|nr:NTP transferase domain-containing protein [Candidatus Bathyanammoxibius amoris]
MNLCSEVAVILAAGKGTRMSYTGPKVLAELCGTPMIKWVIDAARKAGVSRVLVVVGHKKEEVARVLEGLGVDWVEQPRQLGTGDALRAATTFLGDRAEDMPENIVVLPGDSPLVKPDTVKTLRKVHQETRSDATLLTAYLDDPKGYGRVVRNGQDRVTRIVEELDASEEETGIKEVNSGIYCFRTGPLLEALERLTPDNRKGEYYLTQVIEVLSGGMGKRVNTLIASDPSEVLGVNSQEDLEKVSGIVAGGLGGM